ncbi:hypothetical protein IGI49_002366 [Enterococcus sp. AZ071]
MICVRGSDPFFRSLEKWSLKEELVISRTFRSYVKTEKGCRLRTDNPIEKFSTMICVRGSDPFFRSLEKRSLKEELAISRTFRSYVKTKMDCRLRADNLIEKFSTMICVRGSSCSQAHSRQISFYQLVRKACRIRSNNGIITLNQTISQM